MLAMFWMGVGLVLGMLPMSQASEQETTAVSAPYTIRNAAQQVTSLEQMVSALRDADVIFIGENHDHRQGHALELAILTALHRQNPSLVLSLEMFERDVQGVLDEYLQGYITESAFLAASRPWPNYKTDYRPLVEYCKAHGRPVIAANAPRRYVNIVSRKGQAALLDLPKASRAWLPPLPYAMNLPAGYDAALTEVFGPQHEEAAAPKPEKTEPKPVQPAPKPSDAPAPQTKSEPAPVAPSMPSVENLKQAQGLWDTTMAASILTYVRQHRGAQILQINGAMHSDNGYGIVDRLRRAAPRLKIVRITMRPDAAYPNFSADNPTTLADYLIVTPKP